MTLPVFDPQGFLTLSLARAHDRVVKLGDGVALDHKPRATCAVCLVQDGGAYWAHVGDSRIYQLRGGRIHARTRDHSHVELLLREGLIAESEMRSHPMRNFVECCLGGDVPLPDMSVTARNKLEPGDVLLVCTDGLWSGLEDDDLAPRGRRGHVRREARFALSQSVPSPTIPRTATTRALPQSVGRARSRRRGSLRQAVKLFADFVSKGVGYAAERTAPRRNAPSAADAALHTSR